MGRAFPFASLVLGALALSAADAPQGALGVFVTAAQVVARKDVARLAKVPHDHPIRKGFEWGIYRIAGPSAECPCSGIRPTT